MLMITHCNKLKTVLLVSLPQMQPIYNCIEARDLYSITPYGENLSHCSRANSFVALQVAALATLATLALLLVAIVESDLLLQ